MICGESSQYPHLQYIPHELCYNLNKGAFNLRVIRSSAMWKRSPTPDPRPQPQWEMNKATMATTSTQWKLLYANAKFHVIRNSHL
jgi:hypothetical protein